MKVAILSESPADEAGVRILADAILGMETTPVSHAGLRVRGWPSVRDVFPAVLKQLHYRTDAEGLILVVDSNSTPVHEAVHEKPNLADAKCRLCELRRIRRETAAQLRPRIGMPELKTAIGIAVPAIEAWLRCGVDAHVNEASWIAGMKSGRLRYSKADLKRDSYGTTRPPLSLETKCMTEAAIRLAANISSLQFAFPSGFGALVEELRRWAAGDPVR
jgi:hypothetical protein